MKWYRLIPMVVLLACSSFLHAQKISLQEKNATIEDVFHQIEKQSGYFFTYTREQLSGAVPVTVNLKNVSLREALDECLKSQPVTYEISGTSIIIRRKMPVPEYPASLIPTISGKVTDAEDGSYLNGATILIKGSNKGSFSDAGGNFILYNLPVNTVLEISFVGYLPISYRVEGATNNVLIKMSRDSSTLASAIVNTGLYKRPTGSFTGASNAFSGAELKNINPTNIFRALTALDPSLRITENNSLGSDPNALPVIQLRGQNNLPITTQGGTNNSISTAVSNGDIMSGYLSNPNEPLIILDGFQTTMQSIFDLDINRVERVTILKDAAATVAYGSRAANGVIVVETKRPVAGKLQLNYAANVNLQTPELSSYHLLNAKELLEAQRIAGVYTDPLNNANNIALNQWYDQRLYQAASGVNTDWLAQPLQNGLGINNNLNIGGGYKALRFSVNLGLNNTEGIMKGSGRSAYSLATNFSWISRKVRINNTMSAGYTRATNSSWGNYALFGAQFPFFKPYDSAGKVLSILEPSPQQTGIPINAPGGIFNNAMYDATLGGKDFSVYRQFSNTTFIEWSLSKNLRLNGALHFYNQLPSADYYLPAEHSAFASLNGANFSDYGLYRQTRGHNRMAEGRISIDYTQKTASHLLLISAGASLQQTGSEATTIQVSGIPNNYLGQTGLANGYGNNVKPFSGISETRGFSCYTSTSYTYHEQYTLEGTLNASGSSQFGANNHVAPFGAIGAGWNMGKMPWLQKARFVDKLRLQATYGITGNQNFAAYLAQPVYQYNLQYNYRMQAGAAVQGYANPDLKWQQTQKTNFGIIGTLLKGLINLRFDYFIENTNNLILPIGVAPSTGFIIYEDNLGATQNKGFEWAIAIPVIRNKSRNLFWTITLNGSHYTNTIKSLSPAIDAINKANDATNGTVDQQAPLPKFEVGQSMTRIWAVPSLGIDPATGNELFRKKDGTTTFIWDPADKMPVGDASSKIKGIIGNTLSFNGFYISMFLGYEWGGQLYNQTLVDKIENVDLRSSNADKRVLTDRWKKPGDHAKFKALEAFGNATNATSRFVQNNNYIEASSISLGYTFSQQAGWVNKLGLSSPKIYCTQNGVFRLGTVDQERGTAYPFARQFNFGFATGFN